MALQLPWVPAGGTPCCCVACSGFLDDDHYASLTLILSGVSLCACLQHDISHGEFADQYSGTVNGAFVFNWVGLGVQFASTISLTYTVWEGLGGCAGDPDLSESQNFDGTITCAGDPEFISVDIPDVFVGSGTRAAWLAGVANTVTCNTNQTFLNTPASGGTGTIVFP